MIKAVFAIWALSLWTNLLSIHIVKTTCELNETPLALHTQSPRLGWEMASSVNGDLQTAYEVLVASTPEKINANSGDVWSTGKVVSGNSQFITYGGHELKSGRRYFWKVRVWDAKGKPSAWSKLSHFDMGLMSAADWDAQWIGAIRRADANLPIGRKFHKYGMPKAQRAMWDSLAPLAKASIVLRKEFGVDKKTVQRAMVYVAGLGQYELSLNGRKVGNSEFAPLWSDYDKTVYYNAYDVTASLKSGANALGVLLGNGMYNVTGNRYIKFWGSFGPPTLKLKLVLEYADGAVHNIVSDQSWKYSQSPITFNCIFGGEDYDATLEQNGWNTPGFDSNHWRNVVPMEGPNGTIGRAIGSAGFYIGTLQC
jgi:alpha-L-rhamnosidase